MAARWLLDWTIGGRVYRFASDAVSVSDDDGNVFAYVAGLQLDGLTRTADSATIHVFDPTDWASLIEAGVQLERAVMLLRYHRDGQTLEQAEVWLSGLSVGVEYGDSFEALSCTLDASRASQSRSCPPPSSKYGAATWPVRTGGNFELPEETIGAYPPLVFGYPGRDDVLSLSFPAYRVYPFEARGASYADRVGIAYGPIGATKVTLTAVAPITQATDIETQFDVSTTTDLLGQVISYVEPTGSDGWNGNAGMDPEQEVWCYHDTTYGGGVQSNGQVVRGAADVVEYMLRTWTDMSIDQGRWSRWADYLNTIKIDTFIDVPINAWEWVQRAILPLLDVAVRQSSEGVWLMPRRWDATAADSAGHLEVGRNCEREGRVRTREPVRNRFEIRYGLSVDAKRGKWRSTSVLAGEPGLLNAQNVYGSTVTDPRVLSSFVCARSMAVWGELLDTPIETACLWDPASALRVLQLRAMRYGWPKRTLQVSGGADLERYEPGDVVTFTDSGLSITDALALIEDAQQGLEGVRLNITLLDGPAR